jgi:chromosome partitioning protein
MLAMTPQGELSTKPEGKLATWPLFSTQFLNRGSMEESRQTRVIAIGNQKGGVGKTTSAVNIAAALGERGRLCLLWDLDMNHNATRQFGVPPDSFLGTFEVLIGAEKAADVILKPGEVEGTELPPNLHLIPSKRKLEVIGQVLAEQDKFQASQDILLNPLRELRGMYDYIILDTAPNATPPTVAAYKAADYFILTAQPEPWAVEGLNEALRDIKAVQRRGNERLQLLGVIVASVDKRTRLAVALTEYVERVFGSAKFTTIISRSTVVPDSQKERRTLFQSAPHHAVTEQYRQLAAEIEVRIADSAVPDLQAIDLSEVANG